MLKLRLAPLAAIGLSAAIAFAQEPVPDATPKPDAPKVEATASSEAPAKRAPIRRKRKPVAVATPVPVATPAPKKPGFWQRVFGKQRPRPTPAPATPKPTTPKPLVKKRNVTKTGTAKTGTTKTTSTDTKPDNEKPEVTNVESVKPVDTKPPAPKTEERSRPPTIKGSKTKGGSTKVENFPPPPDGSDPDVLEKQKYDQAKAKAASDPKIQELRSKADLAPTEDESRKALRAYNKAMFKRMKEIDPSIKDHVDRMEAAVMSRLGE